MVPVLERRRAGIAMVPAHSVSLLLPLLWLFVLFRARRLRSPFSGLLLPYFGRCEVQVGGYLPHVCFVTGTFFLCDAVNGVTWRP